MAASDVGRCLCGAPRTPDSEFCAHHVQRIAEWEAMCALIRRREAADATRTTKSKPPGPRR